MLVFILFFLTLNSSVVFSAEIATCSGSTGFGYYAYRNLMKEKDVGWTEDKNLFGIISLKQNQNGEIDILYGDETESIYSSVSEGATVIPATISDDAATVIVLYPNRLVETYVFQKLTNGKNQVMWTQAKAETPIPKIAAWIAECSYLNLKALK